MNIIKKNRNFLKLTLIKKSNNIRKYNKNKILWKIIIKEINTEEEIKD